MLSQEELSDTQTNSVPIYGNGVTKIPYILSDDGNTLYHFDSEHLILEVRSAQNPEQLLDTMPIELLPQHVLVAFYALRTSDFLLYSTGGLGRDARDEAIEINSKFYVIDLVKKKAIPFPEPRDFDFEMSEVEHAYCNNPSEVLVKFQKKSTSHDADYSDEIYEQYALYNLQNLEIGSERIILSLSREHAGELFLNADEEPAYVLQSTFWPSGRGRINSDDPERRNRVFEILKENDLFILNRRPIYGPTDQQTQHFQIEEVAFNGDLYGAIGATNSDGDSIQKVVVIRRISSGYQAPQVLEIAEPNEYYSCIQSPTAVVGFVVTTGDLYKPFDAVANTAVSLPSDPPLCERISALYTQLAEVKKGEISWEGSSPREREIVGYDMNSRNFPVQCYKGDIANTLDGQKVLVFSHRVGVSSEIEASIHVIGKKQPAVHFRI